jgi:hypothetical protein
MDRLALSQFGLDLDYSCVSYIVGALLPFRHLWLFVSRHITTLSSPSVSNKCHSVLEGKYSTGIVKARLLIRFRISEWEKSRGKLENCWLLASIVRWHVHVTLAIHLLPTVASTAHRYGAKDKPHFLEKEEEGRSSLSAILFFPAHFSRLCVHCISLLPLPHIRIRNVMFYPIVFLFFLFRL